MSQILLRQTEIPKEWTQRKLRERFPGATIVGDQYGYWFKVEETQVIFMSMDWRGLVKAVNAHLKGNGFAVPADLNYQMMVVYCRETGSSACGEEDLNADERQSYMTMVSRFLRAMEDAVVNGLVDQEEAERRASICVRCPFNLPEKYSFCGGCSTKNVAAKVATMALGRSTPHDADLLTCRVCSCRNNLKIWSKQSATDFPELKDKWWSECWVRPENQ